jgi:hypothetical protein
LSGEWIRSLPYVIQYAFPEGVEVQLAFIRQSEIYHEILDLTEFRQFRVVPLICSVTVLLTLGGAGTLEGPSAGMSAGAAGEIARATKGCCHRGFNPANAGGAANMMTGSSLFLAETKETSP